MGKAVVTISVMPESPDTDLEKVQVEVAKMVLEFAGDGDRKVTIEPIAFGLKCIKYIFVMDEMLGSPDTVAERILKINGVESAEITDVRRAIG